MNQNLVGGVALAASGLVHAWFLTGSSPDRAKPPPAPRAFVTFTVPPEVEPPAPPPPPAVTPDPAPRPKPQPRPAAQTPTPEAPPPIAPPELSGTTLASEAGEAWTAPAGDGSSRSDAIIATIASVSARQAATPKSAPPTAPPRAPEPPAAVPLSGLSRKPAPPLLSKALERNYPRDARSQGQSGEAAVRALIEASGDVRVVQIASESARGFGDACRRTLLGSKWSAPLDRAGKPVATWVTYRCKFRSDG